MDFLNLVLLSLHNITRWALLVFAILVIVRGFSGWLGKKPWTLADASAGKWYLMLFDIQLLLGLILFFTKGWGGALMNFGEIAGTPSVRFFAMEHWLMMLVALIAAHVGSMKIKKAESDIVKHRNASLYYLASLLLVLAAIPWPGMEAGRPLLRFFGLF